MTSSGSRTRFVERVTGLFGQGDLPRLLRFHVLVPLTFLLVVVSGNLLTLPPGPLCDEGMVLFMEGGCDWGESNIFFFSKAGLLVAVNVAFVLCLVRRVRHLRGFVPHLALLMVLSWQMQSGGKCDTYYSHPNGSLGQMTLELAAFSVLGMALVALLRDRGLASKVLGVAVWNGSYVGAFYLWLRVTPHWTWAHTFLLSGTFLLIGLAVAVPSLARGQRTAAQDLIEVAAPEQARPARSQFGWRHVAVSLLLAVLLLPSPILKLGFTLAILWVIARVTTVLARRLGLGGRRGAVAGAATAGVVLFAALAIVIGQWLEARNYSRLLLHQVTEVVDAQAVAVLRDRSTYSRADPHSFLYPAPGVVKHLLEDYPVRDGYSFVILVDLGRESEYVFLRRTSSFGYKDVRRLAGPSSRLIWYDEVEKVLQSRRPFATSLPAFILDAPGPFTYFVGQPLATDATEVRALAFVAKDR